MRFALVPRWARALTIFFALGLATCGVQGCTTPKPLATQPTLAALGPGLWIMDRNAAAPERIVRYAAAVGAGHILPLADGRGANHNQLVELVQEANRRHLHVVPWVYLTPRTQAARMRKLSRLASASNLAGIMLNIEHARGNTSLNRLEELIADFRRQHPGVLVGYTGYNLPLTHAHVGTHRILTWVDFWSPQVYWSHNGSAPGQFLARGQKQWAALLERIGRPDLPIVPVGNVYWSDSTMANPLQERDAQQLRDFVVETAEYPTISWYLYDEVSLKGWATRGLIAANAAHPSAVARRTVQVPWSWGLPLLGMGLGIFVIWLARHRFRALCSKLKLTLSPPA